MSNSKILAACKKIENDISTDSQVFYAPDLKYFDGISHYSTSAVELSVCSVEPSTTADLTIMVSKLNICSSHRKTNNNIILKFR